VKAFANYETALTDSGPVTVDYSKERYSVDMETLKALGFRLGKIALEIEKEY